MISIMEHAHQYVPTKTENVKIDIPCSDEKPSIEVTEYHRLLFGGDHAIDSNSREGGEANVSGATLLYLQNR